MGPGAGVHGGEVVAEGALDDIIGNEASITGDYLAGRREVPVPIRRRKGSGKFLSVKGARANNLRDVDTKIRSEEHTSELQSLMRISYAVFCLKKQKTTKDK